MPEQEIKKRKHGITAYISALLGIAVCLFALSIYAFVNRDAIAEKAAEEAAANTSVKTPDETTPAPTALPSELTTLNSKVYLVDKNHSLPADYVPGNLVTPYLNSAADAIQLEEECGTKAKEMKEAAEKDGISLIVSAGYIDYSTQEDLFNGVANLIGETKASSTTQKAGYSEHQTGLAIDFTNDASVSTPNAQDFAESDAGKWLYEHAHEYGFILRYPEGKESITGYSWTPWHYRYVGVETASAIYAVSPDCTFEEYYGLNGTAVSSENEAVEETDESTESSAENN